MDKRNLMLRMLLLSFLLLTGCGYAAPEKAVRQEMDLIRKLDEPTIQAFVSYESLQYNQSAPPESSAESTEAVKLFFKNFTYRIRSSSVSDDKMSATVELDITNLDAKMLARDLCRAMIRSTASQGGESPQAGLASSFALMKQCLEENTYPLATTPATVQLTNKNGVWVIQESPELEDAIAGGLVSCLNDPYLLSPGEVLSCTLQPFNDFSAQEWINYLQISDVFNTGSDLAPELDATLAERLAEYFSCAIMDISQDGDRATADVQITSLDMSAVCTACRQSLLAYAQTTESIRATDEELRQKTAEYLLDALKKNDSAVANTVSVELINNGYTWEAVFDENFSDALLGGMRAATAILYPEDAALSPEDTVSSPDDAAPEDTVLSPEDTVLSSDDTAPEE